MGTPTQYYVDPSLGSDTGDGSVGTPWGRASGSVVQYALATGITRDSTNGDQINLKSGATDTLAADLVYSGYGTPTAAAPLIVRGYETTANDGVRGVLSGGGSYKASTVPHLSYWIDLECIDGPASVFFLTTGYACGLYNCLFHDMLGSGVGTSGLGSHISNCGFYDIAATGITCSQRTDVVGNYFANSTKLFTDALSMAAETRALGNIFSVGGVSNAIRISDHYTIVANNSILSSGGTGDGVYVSGNLEGVGVYNNSIEGFSGVGGVGINMSSLSTRRLVAYFHNAFANNTTHESGIGDVAYGLGDNEDLDPASLFLKGTLGASDTFAERFDYFAPTAGLQGGSYPPGNRGDKGSVQHADPGGVSLVNTRRNQMIGR